MHEEETAYVLSPDGTYVAQGRGIRVLVWRRSASLVCIFPNGYCSRISAVNWSPDGQLVLAGGWYGEVLVGEVETGYMRLMSRLPHAFEPICALSCSPTRPYLAALTAAGVVQLWHLDARVCVSEVPWGDVRTGLRWSSDGHALLGPCGPCWFCPPA